ncbi:hypothetical protein A1O1_02242 [Capronia coronata CBS 617.96]|uniref:Aquaglyceroporin like protein, other eukaryote n=1 Tax=Capronia coronata CBS 617.96 TaxID=1182541 RepID=W9ZHB3_9EURO|nr:uncharacterized protein A1O1_02242 [Capronia coronata CBS 617.96]EXJ93849.1 hypothetical protein A1O1_02242 [Capronia coronata CBS 617.96]
MSQDGSLRPSHVGSHPHQLETRNSIASPREVPYSLAGPRTMMLELPHTHIGTRDTSGPPVEASQTRSRDQGTFVSQEYQRYNPIHGEPANRPIWGLAAPLPRIRRPGMHHRRSSRQSKDALGRPDPTDQQVQPPAPEGTEAVPQIEVTPSRNEVQHQDLQQRPSRQSQQPPRAHDLLRRATTAHVSTYQPEIVEEPGQTRGEDDAASNHSQLERKLQAEHISARDQNAAKKAMTEDRTSVDRESADVGLQRHTSGSTVQDFAQDHRAIGTGREFGRVGSETEVEMARRRLQGFADTTDTMSDVQHHPPNIDWEEYQKQHLPSQASQTEEPFHPDYFNWWGPVRHSLRQPLAEYLGTTVFMTIGLCGSVVHMTSQDNYGSLLSAYLSWGLGVMIGIYFAGGISGGHLNPTLSVLLSIFRGFPWSLCWQYVIAQMLGAISASGIVYGLYRDAIEQYSAADKGRAGPAFWTSPRDGLSPVAAFFTEFVATAILSGSVLALGDDSNAPPGAGMHAFIIGLLITALCIAFSYNTGTCLNPARDFGPRLITWAAGFGTEVFTLHSWWWIWGPWVGTLTGGIMGATLYDAFIFSGGESPVNYPSGELRGRIHTWREARMKSKTGRGKERKKDIDKDLDMIV